MTGSYTTSNYKEDGVNTIGGTENVTGTENVSGTLNVTGTETIEAGGGLGTIKPGGMLYVTAPLSASGTGADTTEDTLATYSLPASTLNANGKMLRIRAWGTTGANGNNKTMKLYFGGVSLSTGVQTANNKSWVMSMDVLRSGANTQATFATASVDTTGIAPAYQAGSETETGAIVIKATGTNGTASANDIVLKGMTVEMLN